MPGTRTKIPVVEVDRVGGAGLAGDDGVVE